METRSSRYLDEKVVAKPKMSRANKNKYLYDDVNKKIGYEEIDSFSGYNGVVLDKKTPIKTREEYQKVKDYSFIYEDSNIENVTEKVCEEEKVYDIIWNEIKQVNRKLTSYKAIKRLEIKKDEFEKTTTMKIKRFAEIKKDN
jgi:predicted patatin/cPLA2 family phospholipase